MRDDDKIARLIAGLLVRVQLEEPNTQASGLGVFFWASNIRGWLADVR